MEGKNNYITKDKKEKTKKENGNNGIDKKDVYKSIKNSSDILVTIFKNSINKTNGLFYEKY